jgi:hypothetical protein
VKAATAAALLYLRVVHYLSCRVDKGAFVRTAAGFRNQIAPGTQFEPEAGERLTPALRLAQAELFRVSPTACTAEAQL